MIDYLNQLTARQFIETIANEYIELSNDKIRLQRDDHIRWAQAWLKANPLEVKNKNEPND